MVRLVLKRFVLGGAALAVLCCTAFQAPTWAADSKPVQIDMLFPLTGFLALEGTSQNRGALLAMQNSRTVSALTARPSIRPLHRRSPSRPCAALSNATIRLPSARRFSELRCWRWRRSRTVPMCL